MSPAHSHPPGSRFAAPLAVLLVGYPVWWAFGLQIVAWYVCGGMAALWLLRNRRALTVEPGHLILCGFLAWVALSGFMLDAPKQMMAFVMRAGLYAAVLALGLVGWNLIRRAALDPERVVRWIVWLWGVTLTLSLVGLLAPGIGWLSPTGMVAQALGLDDPYIVALTKPHLADLDVLYDVPRPSALFEYTNVWGAAMGAFTPVAIYAFLTARSARRRVVLAVLLILSLIPIVVSVNRGLWVSIGVAVAYVSIRRALSGDIRAVAGSLVALLVGGMVVWLSPLQEVIARRFANANVSTRESLYGAAWELATKSPLLGYGAPQSSAGLADSNDVSIGTHGQLWTILVSQGFVGLALFLAAVIAIWIGVRPRHGRAPEVWLHALGPVVLVQMPFYDVVPMPLTVMLLGAAVIAARTRSPLSTPHPGGATTHVSLVH